MATRKPLLLGLLGAALAGAACAQILGVQEVSDAPGGSGTASTTSRTSSSGASASTSSSASTSTSSASTSSSSEAACAMGGADCATCTKCMETGACQPAYSACKGAYACSGFLDCEVNECPQDSTFTSCAVGDGGCAGAADNDTGYLALKSCVCGGCAGPCPALCK